MFHFPTFPPLALCVQARVTPHDWCGVPPFGNPRINARLTAPRGLSQPPTSFIGSWCQGIHHVHLVACCYYKDARVHCEVLKIRSVPHTSPTPTRTHPPKGDEPERFMRICGPRDQPSRTDPSGPNSVPDSMNTNPARFHSPKGGSTDTGRIHQAK